MGMGKSSDSDDAVHFFPSAPRVGRVCSFERDVEPTLIPPFDWSVDIGATRLGAPYLEGINIGLAYLRT